MMCVTWTVGNAFSLCASSCDIDSCRIVQEPARLLRVRCLTQTTIHRQFQEDSIRALSVSLLAVAAIAASLLLSRDKQERTLSDSVTPADRDLPAEQPLDDIRAAGL